MASIISIVAQATYSAAAYILAYTPIQVGQNVPVAEVTEHSPDHVERELVSKVKNILVCGRSSSTPQTNFFGIASHSPVLDTVLSWQS